MKKLFPIAIVALMGAVTFTSCKKKDTDPSGTYTCTCIFTTSGVTDTAAYTYPSETKSVATTACNSSQTALNNNAGTTGTCTLK